ncbi:MAG: alcohol dehydrogenase catalytic domain-containing protein [Chloroflexi bacterium]|nr:alcohol dehydrogenase catalytic domain-containing protein [Chloroflexota bacterium]
MSYRAYITASQSIPRAMRSWYLSGRGMDSFGQHDQPISEALPEIGADELLTRVDAIGICASDAKMIRLGDEYPLFRGRDLAANPQRLGHELALTVLRIGAALSGPYRVGQRLGLQPDVYYRGERSAIGSMMAGGYTEYMTLGERILRGDAGSYALPVDDSLSYAEVALSEPWACVEAAFRPFRRLNLLSGGLLWISGHSDDFDLDMRLPSRLVVASDISARTGEQLAQQQAPVITADGLDAAQAAQRYGGGAGIDDIILFEPTARQIEGAQRALARRGALTIAGTSSPGAAGIDIGRIHYDFSGIMGTAQSSLAAVYGEAANRSELQPGGVTLVHGAGGSMGQMHILRALSLADPPRVIIATNRGRQRLRALEARFAPLAAQRGVEFQAISPRENPNQLEAAVASLGGCDDILMIFPSLAETQRMPDLLRTGGVLNLFAGVPPGQEIRLDIDRILRDGLRIIGSSGSSLADQARVLQQTAAGQLDSAGIVSAVGGLGAVKAALLAVNARRFAGKIVIYPALGDMPLRPVSNWSKAAETALLREWLGD